MPMAAAIPQSTYYGGLTYDQAFTIFGASIVPEPASLVLFALGALGLAAYIWRRAIRTNAAAGVA